MEWQITMQRFVDILTDSGFKAVFGEQRNREVLMDLINAFLPKDRHVRDARALMNATVNSTSGATR